MGIHHCRVNKSLQLWPRDRLREALGSLLGANYLTQRPYSSISYIAGLKQALDIFESKAYAENFNTSVNLIRMN